MQTPNQRFERDPAIVTRRIGPETVLVPVRTSTTIMNDIFALNDTAALVWDALAAPATLEQLSSALAAEYDVDLDEAQRDVRELLQQFAEARIIREVA
jgi:hypothetical protein